MMKAVTKDIEAKTADKEQYAKHINALLLDRGAQYPDVLPFWDSNNINLLFDAEEGYMSFTPEQKHNVVSLLERVVVITIQRIALDNRKKADKTQTSYGQEIIWLHRLRIQLMDALHEACWKTKANKEQAIKDAALAKEREEMQHKVEQNAAASYAQAEGQARKPNKWGKKPLEAFDP